MMKLRRGPLASLLAVALVSIALPAPPPAAGAARSPSLRWVPCTGEAQQGFQCATLAVPLDYGKPHGAQIKLALIRQPALDGHAEHGSLVTNFGGPGGSGLSTLPTFVQGLDPRIRNAFDLVSFDPRGVGASDPLDCHAAPEYNRILRADPNTAPGAAQIVSGFRAIGTQCLSSYGQRKLSHIGTRNVVRDLNRIRAALGDKRMTYDGLSYGTRIGAVYADYFPKHIRAFVLDGAMDPRPDFHTLGLDQAQTWEDVFSRLLSQCAADPSCPLRPDPQTAFDDLLAQVRAHPLPAPEVPSGGRLTAGWLGQAAVYGMTFVNAQQPLEQGIADALATGDGSELLALGEAAAGKDPETGRIPAGTEVFAAVNCIDSPTGSRRRRSPPTRLKRASTRRAWARLPCTRTSRCALGGRCHRALSRPQRAPTRRRSS